MPTGPKRRSSKPLLDCAANTLPNLAWVITGESITNIEIVRCLIEKQVGRQVPNPSFLNICEREWIYRVKYFEPSLIEIIA